MRLILGLMLTSIFIILFLYSYKKNKDIFSPLCIFSLFQFLRYVPHMINTDIEHWFVLSDESIFKLFCIEMIFVIFVLVGYRFWNRCYKKPKELANKNKNVRISLIMVLLVYIVGLCSRLYIIYRSGGILYILNNPAKAYLGLSSGFGYMLSLANMMLLSMLMLMEKIRNEKKQVYFVLLFIMAFIYAVSFFIFTSRSPALEMIMVLVFGYNYLFKRIKIKSLFKPKFFILIVLILSVIIILPTLRSGNTGQITSDYGFKGRFFKSIFSVFDEFSYVGRDAFVYDYFNINNYWFGKNFLNLLVAPIPSAIYKDKPPLDDGIYLNHLLHGIEIEPTTGRTSLLFNYSIPFSTQGSMYANFGIVGVMVGGLFLGIMYAYFYYKLKMTNSGLLVILYQLVVYQLELSTLSIIQTLIPLIVVWITYKVAFKTLNRIKWQTSIKKGETSDKIFA